MHFADFIQGSIGAEDVEASINNQSGSASSSISPRESGSLIQQEQTLYLSAASRYWNLLHSLLLTLESTLWEALWFLLRCCLSHRL